MPSTRTTTLLLGVAAFASQVSAHCALVGIHGANGIVGLGYGVNRYGKYPHSGKTGDGGPDAGADVTMFQAGVDLPDPPCGESPELGPLDPEAWLSQSEGFGIPSAHPDGSISFTAFQVNSDGAGDMKCEYNENADLKSWTPLTMNQNMPGNGGVLQGSDRTNHTVKVTFPKEARCSGGISGNTCVARCRTGRQTSTGLRYRFGGCFAIRLNGTEGAAGSAPTSNTSELPADDSSSTEAAPEESSSGDSSSSGTAVTTGSTKVVEPSSGDSSTGSEAGTTTTTKTTRNINLTKAQMNKIIKAVLKKMRQRKMVAGGTSPKRSLHRRYGNVAARSHHI